MGRIIISHTFDLRLLAQPGYCSRVQMEETTFEQVRRAARRDVFVLEVDDTDEWARYSLGQILERLGTDRVYEVKDHFMEIGDTLYVCSNPEGSRWFRVQLLSDMELYAKTVPNLESEVVALERLLREIDGPIAYLPERLRLRGEQSLARRCRQVINSTTATVISDAIRQGNDDVSRQRVVMRIAMDRLEK